jgi:hypothetical protein
LRVQVILTTSSSRSRVPGQVTAIFVFVPVQVVLLSVELAVSARVYGLPTGMPGMVFSTSRSLRTSSEPVAEKPFGPVNA